MKKIASNTPGAAFARPFTIDPSTKEIRAGAHTSLTLAQRSHNTERFTFSIAGTAMAGHDITACNSVMIHFQNVSQDLTQRSVGIYKVEDLTVTDNTVTLSWLIGTEATLHAGSLMFSIHFACIAEDGAELFRLPTLTYSRIIVGATTWSSDTIVKEYPDIIADFEARLAAMESAPAIHNAVTYADEMTVHLGENVLGNATLGAGWSVADGVYTHTTGSTEDLTFATMAEDGAVYLLEFDTSYTANEFVRVGIGDRYRVLCYNGKNHITVPLLASGGTTLYITPIAASYAGSISNITLRKIQDDGEERVLALYNTTTNNHSQNYGFWNTFIGGMTAENAVGTTRSIAIGHQTLRDLQGGHRNIGIGTFAMSQLIGGEENISIGADSMLAVKEAMSCFAMGFGAMYEGTLREKDIAIGKDALRGYPTSTTQNNIGIGEFAGYKVKTAKNNIFIGQAAGYNIDSGSMNTFIGSEAGRTATSWGCTAIGPQADTKGYSKSIAIGYQATATKSSQAVLGGDDIVETLLKGNLVVRGLDGVKRQIVFNEDGTVGWTAV